MKPPVTGPCWIYDNPYDDESVGVKSNLRGLSLAQDTFVVEISEGWTTAVDSTCDLVRSSL